MTRIVKLFTASLLTLALSVATVLCCCSASAAMAHFQKVDSCSQCPSQKAHDNSSNSAGACQQQLTSAEFSPSQAISTSVSGVHSLAPVSFDKHIIILLSSSVLAYPRGSPPWTASFAPLYLRTFNLRI